MSNELVAYSRAGDVFHYRWAARRCLQLIYPSTRVRSIVIEGSIEKEKAGEYVIDVSEYTDLSGKGHIDYYQLKHTTTRKNTPFTQSQLSKTFSGFAKRFRQHAKAIRAGKVTVSFAIITNRKIADRMKVAVQAIGRGEHADTRLTKTLERITSLRSRRLKEFCGLVHLEDSEGDYRTQKEELRIELTQLLAGAVDNAQVNNLVALIQDKVLPESDHVIHREDVLRVFGISAASELYPAPAVWEELPAFMAREQHGLLMREIAASSQPVIVHAQGGVGKSVFCQQLLRSLPEGSLAVAFDCFGAGKYRNRSETRHRHRTALVQVVNELAAKGLCDPVLNSETAQEADLMRKFLLRLEAAVRSLQQVNASAQLFILIDAADNAEMAAKEFGENCFAHELIRERPPEGCKIALLCRTERISLLHPQESTRRLELKPFSLEETTRYLQGKFPTATASEAEEFHRLTSGNPRVQANALEDDYESTHELLRSLGPSPVSVERQIESKLEASIGKIRDSLPQDYQKEIHSICQGLAMLPPLIPIEVLSRASGISAEHIRSFVADMGRPLWLSDRMIQFRDEPTETWFRQHFLAQKEDYKAYIARLGPLAGSFPYVANALPQLYLGAEEYDNLVAMALSDDFLPKDNPIDTRNARIYRLQFAFKAALRAQHFTDVIKLAMRAGEEVAGNTRQLALFRCNVDLLTSLQDNEKVQEIAFQRLVGSQWVGSENAYSASLLSGIKEYHGEAGGYLRAAINWLHLHFEDRRKNEDRFRQPEVQHRDILELAYAYLNIHGIEKSLAFLRGLEPKTAIFTVIGDLTKRLVDLGRFAEIAELLPKIAQEPYYLMAAVDQLLSVGLYTRTEDLKDGLDLLSRVKSRIKKPEDRFDDPIVPAILSYLESCLHQKLSPEKLLAVLDYYVPIESRFVYSTHHSLARTIYLRAVAIRAVLAGQRTLDVDGLLSREFAGKKEDYDRRDERKEFREVAESLFPWFLLRAQILTGAELDLSTEISQTAEVSSKASASRYRGYDSLPGEITDCCASLLLLGHKDTPEKIIEVYEKYLASDKAFSVDRKLKLLHAAYRLPHLAPLRSRLESAAYEAVRSRVDDGPDEIADRYVSLSRAVLTSSKDDASSYFEKAISIVSKFGDELVQRWESIVALAVTASKNNPTSDELAYRFIRCAELVGENVSREKHWSRSGAIRICAQMSPGIAIAALSRWRDREVGQREYQLETLLTNLVQSGQLAAEVGWSMTRFLPDHGCHPLLSACLERASSGRLKEAIAEDAVRRTQVEGAPKEHWKQLAELASRQGMSSETLTQVIAFYSIEIKNGAQEENEYRTPFWQLSADPAYWDPLFAGLNPSTQDGFTAVLGRFGDEKDKKYTEKGWRDLLVAAISRVEWEALLGFVDLVLQADRFDQYDVRAMLTYFPPEWKKKVSYAQKWEKILCRFAKRFTIDLCNAYIFQSFVTELSLNTEQRECFKAGIFEGLAERRVLSSADLFFGFVELAASSVSEDTAAGLVSFSLSRFELHLSEDFGDGPWSSQVPISPCADDNIAGYIWSALGSPRSGVRWQAAHTIRKLADFGCVGLVDDLTERLNSTQVGAFGSSQYPFYLLHARQYLLMALARIALDHPAMLLKHSHSFTNLALSEMHALIQRFAADMAVRIEVAFPGTIEAEQMKALASVSKSPFPILQKDHRYRTVSYWHQTGQVRQDLDVPFGYDFDRYWFEPLGDVFGVSGNQIEELAAQVVVVDWGLPEYSGRRADPRDPLWDRSSRDQETWHSHSSYPKADNLDFYLSYHAMLVVAARLLEKMPIVQKGEGSQNEWEEWISRHLPTRTDGKWLADCRGSLPLRRPDWLSAEQQEGWENGLAAANFIANLVSDEADGCWINVRGGWTEQAGNRDESCTVSSALVSAETSDALLRALSTCSDPYDYRLPDAEEEDMELDAGIFTLQGWIAKRSSARELDDLDPYAANLDYPPYYIGQTIMDRLGLTATDDGTRWHKTEAPGAVLLCETWTSAKRPMEEKPDQCGMRLRANLSLLKNLCRELDCHLIFDIGMHRDRNRRYDREKREYTPPTHKIFILSAD